MTNHMLLNMDFLETSSVCRLCLKISSGGNIQMLEGFTMYMLKLVAPAVNLEISYEPKICKNCAEKLKSTYDFKSVCLENNGISQPAFLNKTKPQKENGCKCCLCDNKDNLKKCKANEILFLTTMLEKCLPELDMEKISTICQECLRSVVHLFAFLNCCLDTEDKIKKYAQVNGLNKKGQVSILDIFHANIIVKEETRVEVEELENSDEAEEDPEPVDTTDWEQGTSDSDEDSEAEVKTDIFKNTRKMERFVDCGKSTQDMNGKPRTSPRIYKEDETVPRGGNFREVPMYVKTETGCIPIHPPYKCHHCGYSTNRKACLTVHLKKHTGLSNNTSVNSNTAANLDVHMITPNGNLQFYKCDKCSYETSIEDKFLKHECPKRSSMNCPDCDYTTEDRMDFCKHLMGHEAQKTAAPAPKPHQSTNSQASVVQDELKCKDTPVATKLRCRWCKYRTKRKFELHCHLMNVHKMQKLAALKVLNSMVDSAVADGEAQEAKTLQNSSVPMFRCPSCIYQTKRRYDLSVHLMRIHDMKKAEAKEEAIQIANATKVAAL